MAQTPSSSSSPAAGGVFGLPLAQAVPAGSDLPLLVKHALKWLSSRPTVSAEQLINTPTPHPPTLQAQITHLRSLYSKPSSPTTASPTSPKQQPFESLLTPQQQSQLSAVAVVALLLQYIAALPQPLIPFKLYYTATKLARIGNEKKKYKQMRVFLQKLPSVNRVMILSVCEWLESTHIDSGALAQSLTPLFLRPSLGVPACPDEAEHLFRCMIRQVHYLNKTITEPVTTEEPFTTTTSSTTTEEEYTLEGIALYDLPGGSQWVLPLTRNQKLLLLDVKSEDGWLQASTTQGVIGFVPEAYVDILPVTLPSHYSLQKQQQTTTTRKPNYIINLFTPPTGYTNNNNTTTTTIPPPPTRNPIQHSSSSSAMLNLATSNAAAAASSSSQPPPPPSSTLGTSSTTTSSSSFTFASHSTGVLPTVNEITGQQQSGSGSNNPTTGGGSPVHTRRSLLGGARTTSRGFKSIDDLSTEINIPPPPPITGASSPSSSTTGTLRQERVKTPKLMTQPERLKSPPTTTHSPTLSNKPSPRTSTTTIITSTSHDELPPPPPPIEEEDNIAPPPPPLNPLPPPAIKSSSPPTTTTAIHLKGKRASSASPSNIPPPNSDDVPPPPPESAPLPQTNTPPPPPPPPDEDELPPPPDIEEPPPPPPTDEDDDLLPPPPPLPQSTTTPSTTNWRNNTITTTAAAGGMTKEELEKTLRKRHAIAKEVVDTETTYVGNLHSLCKVFLERHKTMSMGLTKTDIFTLLSNVEVIYNCHVKLLKLLSTRLTTWDDNSGIGEVFLKETGWIKLYKYYINNFSASDAALKHWRSHNPEFQSYLKQVEYTADMMGQNIESLLMTPVQRIPRYVMLLGDLLKATPTAHPDKQQLTGALEFISELAEYINEKKREADNIATLIEVQNKFSDYPNTGGTNNNSLASVTQRQLLKEGNITVNKEKSRVWLFTDLMIITSPDTKRNGKYKFRMQLGLTTSRVQRDSNGSDEFRLLTTEGILKLQFSNTAECEEWYRRLEGVLRSAQDMLLKSAFTVTGMGGGIHQSEGSTAFHKLQEQAQEKKRAEIIKKMAEQEAEYVTLLTHTQTTYLGPLKRTSTDGSTQAMISAAKANVIAINWEQLVESHTVFLADLQDRVREWTDKSTITDLFEEHGDFLKYYGHYVSHHSEQLEMLEREQHDPDNQLLMFWLRETETREKSDLRALLERPLRRVSEYYLMLQEMLQNTPKKHPDVEPLNRVVDKLCKLKDDLEKKSSESKHAQLAGLTKLKPGSTTGTLRLKPKK